MNIIQAACDGDVNALRLVKDWTPSLIYKVVRKSVKHGHLHVLECLVSILGMETINRLEVGVWTSSIKYARFHILEWLQKVSAQESDLDAELLGYAVYCGKAEVVRWLLDHRPSNQIDTIIWSNQVTNEMKREVMILLHQRNVQGEYTKACNQGECCVCKVIKVWNCWEMDVFVYDSVMQWLPREIIGDVGDLAMV